MSRQQVKLSGDWLAVRTNERGVRRQLKETEGCRRERVKLDSLVAGC